MEPIYRKVFIKSEADLPEEETYYFVKTKGYYDRNIDIFYWRKTNFLQGKQNWLNSIDWYLQPVELPSDEEIEQYAQKTTHGNTVNGAKWMRDKLINK